MVKVLLEDFDDLILDANWIFHEVGGSSVDLIDGKIGFQGNGVAVYEHKVSTGIGSSMTISILMQEPVTHGGSGFGWSNYDYSSIWF